MSFTRGVVGVKSRYFIKTVFPSFQFITADIIEKCKFKKTEYKFYVN